MANALLPIAPKTQPEGFTLSEAEGNLEAIPSAHDGDEEADRGLLSPPTPIHGKYGKKVTRKSPIKWSSGEEAINLCDRRKRSSKSKNSIA
ncbi:hypothetical protein EZJ55_24810 [Microcystis aeruginosa EAWAG127a]|uniref:Uncharacterized protein n=1 Tax=Microcystis aeruginosa EAWAG127a TaxID=2529855 RepID=A0A5J5LPP5_MICAE|nr:hypothetical protein [Microcystis aeruginosa]KAB0238289.1 hypothetical protein EZJ55_24810 [Microcystis aeruginosa EAWAG127a]